MFYMILLLIAIFAILILKRFRKQDEIKKIESDADKELNEMDFEKLFFERTKSGEKAQLLLSIASQQDCLMLRSLLFSEGIPSYVEGEHMNNIYGGISGTMTTVVAIKLYILCNDYEKALEIIKDAQTADLSGITIHPKAES